MSCPLGLVETKSYYVEGEWGAASTAFGSKKGDTRYRVSKNNGRLPEFLIKHLNYFQRKMHPVLKNSPVLWKNPALGRAGVRRMLSQNKDIVQIEDWRAYLRNRSLFAGA